MNLWQIARQVKYLLGQAKWDDDSTPVFAAESVIITDVESIYDINTEGLIEPIVVLVPNGGTTDPNANGQQSDHLVNQLGVVLVTRNFNLRAGEGAFVGANREGINDSRGRGLLELVPRVFETIKRLTIDNGINIQVRSQSEAATRRDATDNIYAIQEFYFEVACATDLEYPGCRRFKAVPRTGEVTLTWKNPASRYDRYRTRLVRKSGSVAPTSITDGTVLAAGVSDESFVDSGLAAGTYSYSLFMTYDDFSFPSSPSSDLRVSDSVTQTGVVVP